MYIVYILESLKSGQKYIGITADIKIGFAQHNKGSVRSTKTFRPYKVVRTEQFINKTGAPRREHQLKASGVFRKENKHTVAPSSNG